MISVQSRYLLVCVLVWCTVLSLQAQEATIETGKQAIALDEPFIFKLVIEGTSAKNTYTAFPQIPGMVKSGLSSSTETTTRNGQALIIQTVTQSYLATKPGTYKVQPFTITVNGAAVKSVAISIQVGPPADPDYVFQNKLYEELMEMERERNEYKDIQADAFFALTTSKEKVFVGEGFMVLLSLYVAETNKAELEFYQVDQQLIEILKKIRPASCWEDNYNIEEVLRADVAIEGKKYVRYTIYQAMYYPLNTNPVIFPETGLKMIKFKVRENADSLAGKKKQEFTTFYTRTKRVSVSPLPAHPLKEQVSVGVFRLKEAISKRNLETGKSFTYQVDIIGEGNFSAIDLTPRQSVAFDFFSPAVKLQVHSSGNKTSGIKTFTYQIIPKEPGLHVLRNYFEWIYFNTEKEKYDTLSSSISVEVTGESQKNADILVREVGPVYKNMLTESNRLREAREEDWVRMFANLFILLMLLTTFILFFIKK